MLDVPWGGDVAPGCQPLTQQKTVKNKFMQCVYIQKIRQNLWPLQHRAREDDVLEK